ncbi:DUF4250 domain-containing protein [Agarivorans sp. MS3-6]|uniref:DUF4250 domain-containing protein n=1 Tax=Agarivorans sp. TSD2052 TaxID=2937286 RepID=UPI00200EA251|nr:DUF4250 domain-containing protein [Agarivorans sp. TSD2052]UPW18958.1 DUF4250 domain-containing protein [Agarivorans sp. TSD2052]
MMDASYLLNLEPSIILGIVNEKLRLECDSLEDLALTFGFEERSLSRRLETIGYHYDVITNQFKAI